MSSGHRVANAAVAYGHGLCNQIVTGCRYGQMATDATPDIATADGYHASYLISRATVDIRRRQMWRLSPPRGWLPHATIMTARAPERRIR